MEGPRNFWRSGVSEPHALKNCHGENLACFFELWFGVAIKKMVNSIQRSICWFEVVTSNLAFIVLLVSSFARNSCWQFSFVFFSASYSSPCHHGCHVVVRIRELGELHMRRWWLKVCELRMAFQLSCFLPFLFFMFFSFSFSSSLCFLLYFSSSFFLFLEEEKL